MRLSIDLNTSTSSAEHLRYGYAMDISCLGVCMYVFVRRF